MSQPGVVLLVHFVGGQALVRAGSLMEYWRAVKADGFLSFPETKQLIPFHAMISIQEAPAEMLNQMQTGGNA